jgi:Ca2+-binding EF-hand superfamily protein
MLPSSESPHLRLQQDTAERLHQFFTKYEVRGSIDKEDLGHLIQDLGFTTDATELTLIMDALDTDKSGHISFDEFLQAHERGEVVCEVATKGEMDQWEQCWDEGGNKYFYHQTTGFTSWFRPQVRQRTAKILQDERNAQEENNGDETTGNQWNEESQSAANPVPGSSSTDDNLQQLFMKYGAAADGASESPLLDEWGLSILLATLGFSMTDNEVHSLFLSMDADHSGGISWAEFWTTCKEGTLVNVVDEGEVDNWEECLDKNGYTFFFDNARGESSWHRPQFKKHAMNQYIEQFGSDLDKNLTHEQLARKIFWEFDKDNSGEIDSSELYSLVLALSGSPENFPEGFLPSDEGEVPQVVVFAVAFVLFCSNRAL